MNPTTERWKEITRSEFPWEQEALAFVRERLPDQEPYRAWATFEFIADDGSINEVDLLVLTPKGFFLVEIKSRPGMVKGDAGTWTWFHEGGQVSVDNPILLANRKAKRLASLLRRQKACAKIRVPFLQPLVFLSAPHVNCQLDPAARQGVHVRDLEATADQPARHGIIAALTRLSVEEATESRRNHVDTPIARALSRAMEEAGIRPSQRQRRVGDYVLTRLLFEGPTYQDWDANHASLPRVTRRVRIYPVATKASRDTRKTMVRAAQREFQILEGIQHPGILHAVGFHEHELGPALVFEHEPKAVRLDHFLSEPGHRLDVDLRLGLLRQIAEALQYAHKKKLVHRALSPQSILVLNPEAPVPRIQLFNWQTATREFGSTTSRAVTATLHLGDLVEAAATPYMAPEALTDPQSRGEQLDVFGLGAIAYHLFAGVPPAASFLELVDRLREGKGLQIASVVNGAGENLRDMIKYSTHPEVTSRIDSVTDFLGFLEKVEEELTAPTEDKVPRDPTDATVGDHLEGGYVVKKRLGKGSTAVVFLVEKDQREQVLKLALDPNQNDRLRGEGEVLVKLRHQHIVELHGTAKIGDRFGLLMAKAGDETLAQRLRAEGRLHVDLLQRFGEDLLQALQWLEHEGIPHRDIKPDNIAIAPIGRSDRLHLVLFDFSLSRAPAERFRAGTVAYLDPFLSLRKPPRWDLNAERFAAAMTLYEMATGTLPKWGDGKSDPAVLDCEVTLDTELFEASLREPLTAFLGKALRRDFQARFDNAEEMLHAWRQVFERVDRPTITTDHTDEAGLDTAIASATLETPLVTLGLSTRAINALERVSALDVQSLLRLPVTQISHMRGVGHKTRREVLDVLRKLAARFPAVRSGETGAPSDEAEAIEPRVSSVDLLAQQLLPSRPSRSDSSEPRGLRTLLGLDDAGTAAIWPSQTDVAVAHDITRARVGQILAKARERWARNASLTSLRDEIAEVLRAQGGVMTAAELSAAVLATRGSAYEEPKRSRLASAVTRATSETERERTKPRWIVRRAGEQILIALDEDVDGQRLADYAEQLGRAADRLATTDPLPSPARVLEALQVVRPPDGSALLPPNRLVRLAAAVSTRAAVSSRLELYPRGMSVERAIKLAHGALLGASELTIDQVRERVIARYPEADLLPGRPILDSLLEAAGSYLTWVAEAAQGRGAYRALRRDMITLSSGSTPPVREPTGDTSSAESTPELADARRLEERLQRAAREGAFLALMVDPRYLDRAAAELAGRFDVEVRSLDEVLIRHMRAEAARVEADWAVVLRADTSAPESRDWQNLLLLVRRALAALEPELAAVGRTLVLTYPGLLARYGQMDALERLRDRVGRRPGPGAPMLHGLWVLIPASDVSALPVLDDQAIPVIGPSQWARLTSAWLANAHRAGNIPAPGEPHPVTGVPR
jgi:serine/threonine protein kinase